jgi:hypothetical protein
MTEQRAPGGGDAGCEGGNKEPTLTETEISNFLAIVVKVVPIEAIEWGVLAK